jgi:antitoxin MazE
MQSRVVKWGNSLGIRIPRSLAKQVNLQEGCPVDLQVTNGTLVIRRPSYTLDSLLSQVTVENLYSEVETGDAMGREQW